MTMNQYPSEYVACRTLGHAWDQIPSTRRPAWGKLMTFRCLRCTMVREDVIDLNYHLGQRRYLRPNDYSTVKADRTEWRRQLATLHDDMVTEGDPPPKSLLKARR